MLSFREPVRFQVIHPEHGSVIVSGYSSMQAKLEAAREWDVPFVNIADRCTIAVETAALAGKAGG